MSATVILTPAAAVEEVAHPEQLQIWVDDHLIGALALGNFLRDSLDYSEVVDLHETLARELKEILTMAFDHPAARTIARRT